MISGAEGVLTDIESLRKMIAHPYGKLMISSGAIALKKFGFISALKGFLLQIFRDVEADVTVSLFY